MLELTEKELEAGDLFSAPNLERGKTGFIGDVRAKVCITFEGQEQRKYTKNTTQKSYSVFKSTYFITSLVLAAIYNTMMANQRVLTIWNKTGMV